MESKVFSFILALFQKIALWFDNSAVGKLYDKICKACYKAFYESKMGSRTEHRLSEYHDDC